MTTPAKQNPLNSSLEDCVNLSMGAFSRIRGIARCALLALETDAGVNNLEAIAEALTAIAMDADMAHNVMDAEAEKHGIETSDPAWSRRLMAMHSPRQAPANTGSLEP